MRAPLALVLLFTAVVIAGAQQPGPAIGRTLDDFPDQTLEAVGSCRDRPFALFEEEAADADSALLLS